MIVFKKIYCHKKTFSFFHDNNEKSSRNIWNPLLWKKFCCRNFVQMFVIWPWKFGNKVGKVPAKQFLLVLKPLRDLDKPTQHFPLVFKISYCWKRSHTEILCPWNSALTALSWFENWYVFVHDFKKYMILKSTQKDNFSEVIHN